MSQVNLNTPLMGAGPASIDAPHVAAAHTAATQINNPAARLTPPAIARQQGEQQIPRMELRELAGRVQPGPRDAFARFCQGVHEFFHVRGAGLPRTLTISMPGGQPLQVSGAAFASMIKALPLADRAAARESLVAHIEARLANGHELAQTVSNGQRHGPASTGDVADLMLFMQLTAQAGGNGFSDGALSIEDPQGNLYAFLNGCPEKYLRSSSHMKALQQVAVDGHTNIHRGIDIPQGPDGLLHGMATTLFAAIPERNDAPRRLFFKPESCGARLSTLSARELQAEIAAGETQRPWRNADLGEMMGHAFSFLATRGQGSAAGSRKERIPDSIQKNYQQLCSSADFSDVQKQQLNRGKPLDNASGLHTMLDNLQLIYAGLTTPAQREQFLQHVEPLLDAMQNMAQVSDLKSRIGNEVILNSTDLETVRHGEPQTTASKRARAVQALFNLTNQQYETLAALDPTAQRESLLRMLA